jgi:hypothetical protein
MFYQNINSSKNTWLLSQFMFIHRDGKTANLTAVFNALHAFIAHKYVVFSSVQSKKH